MNTGSRPTRRVFLRGAGVAALAPYFVPAAALGKAGRAAPSERITIGLIGIGNMGSGHLSNILAHRELQLVAVCDVDAVKRKSAKEKTEKNYAKERESGTYKGCDEYNEFERLLERVDIDAVLVAVPDHWHAAVAIAACRAGKDVYCEKPLSLTIREAWEMVAVARRYQRVFQTGSQQRSAQNFRYACELVRSGKIGRLIKVNVGIGGPSREKYFTPQPVREGLDWERWLGPAPWQPYHPERCSGDYGGGWRHIRDYSGGMMTDWGAHHIDIAQWGIGMDGSGPVEINPPRTPPDIRQTPDPDKGPTLTYKYANGVELIHGGANGILFTGTDGKVEVNREYFKTWPDEIGKIFIGPNDTHLYASSNHFQNWIDCIRARRRPIADVEIGASSVTVCHLGNIAYWLGRPLRWDPAKHAIIGDETASRWLDRPKRGPWRTYV
ncbi:MAG: Gfo/Idh/MocA family oxidoreductase [Planctomycetes bacterium]|nr:Gfo/Idh/MocA family oxidoreductase [Planctomycetota bacterium]